MTTRAYEIPMNDGVKGSRIQIVAPSGDPRDAQVLIDGHAVEGLCTLRLTIDPNEYVRVEMQLEASSVDIDASLVERVFTSPKEIETQLPRLGEQHAQLMAEMSGSFDPQSAEGTAFREIAQHLSAVVRARIRSSR